MDNRKTYPNEKPNVAPGPGYANDQLGENASEEFAQDYNNKSNIPLHKPEVKK